MILSCVLLLLFGISVRALSTLEVAHGRFVHTETQREFRPLGLYYSTTNVTDFSEDSLSSPEACLRDAALFQQLGINSIAVTYTSTELSHDECMSIFNAAGIYVVIAFDEHFGSWGADLDQAYSFRTLERAFKLVKAFSHYENILGFSIVNVDGFDTELTPLQQPYLRAYVRDVKAYMTQHSPGRDIPIGVSRVVFGPQKTAHMRHALDYARCAIPGATEPSQLDFFAGVVFDQTATVAAAPSEYYEPFAALPDQNIPLALNLWRIHEGFLPGFGFDRPTDNFTHLTDNVYRNETIERIIAGGLVHEWANIVYQAKNFADAGLVGLDPSGNLQMRPAYDSFASALRQLNLDELRNGERQTRITTDPACTSTRSLVVERGPSGIPTTITYNNTWALPTPPPGVASMISSGVSGLQGSHVLLTATSPTQTIRDSTGAIITNLAITASPSLLSIPSQTPPTFPSAPPISTTSSPSLGFKIGLGITIPTCIILVGISAYLLWRRQNSLREEKPLDGEKAELPDRERRRHEVHGESVPEIMSAEKFLRGAAPWQWNQRERGREDGGRVVYELQGCDVSELPTPV